MPTIICAWENRIVPRRKNLDQPFVIGAAGGFFREWLILFLKVHPKIVSIIKKRFLLLSARTP
jgi:hypothetical protein